MQEGEECCITEDEPSMKAMEKRERERDRAVVVKAEQPQGDQCQHI